MPAFIMGVINLRGNVVPIIDLRLKLGMKASTITGETCFVVVEVEVDDVLSQMGLVVDAVNSVIDIEPEEIAPPPKTGMHLKSDFLAGMGKIEEKFIIILNIDRVLTDEEMGVVKEVGNSEGASPSEAAEEKNEEAVSAEG